MRLTMSNIIKLGVEEEAEREQDVLPVEPVIGARRKKTTKADGAGSVKK